jgi:hypothetical protein
VDDHMVVVRFKALNRGVEMDDTCRESGSECLDE